MRFWLVLHQRPMYRAPMYRAPHGVVAIMYTMFTGKRGSRGGVRTECPQRGGGGGLCRTHQCGPEGLPHVTELKLPTKGQPVPVDMRRPVLLRCRYLFGDTLVGRFYPNGTRNVTSMPRNSVGILYMATDGR